MDETAITNYIVTSFPDVALASSLGYTFFFVGPDRKMPFATIATQDNEYDRVSNLDRPAVFRLNMGVSRETYRAMFGPKPAAPGATGVVDTGHDFAALDHIMPHPTYAPQSWVCVLNPSEGTLPKVRSLLAEAYAIAAKRHRRASTTK
jgi:Family of unknown function (DUF6194)